MNDEWRTFITHHSAFIISMKGGDPLQDTERIAGMAVLWIAVITGAHLSLNVDWTALLNERLPESTRRLNVAYIPVT
jgi:hypothetical protein